MSRKKQPDKNEGDRRDDVVPGNTPSPDDDLKFATDSTPGFGPSARRRQESTDGNVEDEEPDGSAGSESHEAAIDPEKTWVPTDTLPGDETSASDDTSLKDTWVPPADGEKPSKQPETKEVVDAQLKDTWVPQTDASNVAAPSGNPNAEASSDGSELKDTWVPSADVQNAAPPSTQPEGNDADDPALNDTWVPPTDKPSKPSDAKSSQDDSDVSFVDTWVPPDGSTDTNSKDGTIPTADKPVEDESAKTWVPSNTPTQSGIGSVPQNSDTESEDAATDELDPDSTWVPAGTPTHHDFSFDSDGDFSSEDDDPNRTVLPSETPTIDLPPTGLSGTPQEAAKQEAALSGDFDQTQDLALSGNQSRPAEPDTVVVPDNKGVPAKPDARGNRAATPTTASILPGDFDQTEVFTKTVGMRNLSDEEYDDWQENVADVHSDDTVALEQPAGKSKSASGTQIWDRQTADGLDASLIIRSRPVAGDESFEGSGKTETPDYDIIEKIAEGGMGAIYLARQTSLDRELAIKTLKPLKERERKSFETQGRIKQVDKQRREMFLSEALVTANLVHPHIIPIHDLCQTEDGFPFYSMKRVKGIPWNDRITEMSLDENIEVLHKTCDAMAYAHHNGVVNRDLKPENVMLGEFGEVLVLDWGLAVPASVADRKKFASPAAPHGAGTPAYMSPELWSGPAEAIGPWSDIYLLGAILFEVVTGKTPHGFPKPDPKAGATGLWLAIDGVVRVNEIRQTEVTGELLDIALKAMSTEPTDRYASVLDFQQAVREFQTHEESRHLADRAATTLRDAHAPTGSRGYQNFQTAAALYEEAYNEWPENKIAREGLYRTRLAYASLAQQKGDFDLGLQIAAQEEGEEFTALAAQMTRARNFRNRLKQAMVTAAGIIVVIGAIAGVMGVRISQQNHEIVALHGDKEALTTETQELSVAKTSLEDRKKELEAQRTDLLAEQDSLLARQKRLITEQTKLAAAKSDLEKENGVLEGDKKRLVTEKTKLSNDKAQLMTEVADVTQQKLAIDEQLGSLQQKQKQLAEQTARAAVELQNTSIASLVRNADFATALQRIDELIVALDSEAEFATLPKTERQQRKTELEARQRLLRQRTRATDAPVQVQVMSPSGKSIVWGDSSGKLTVWQTDPQTNEFADMPVATLQIDNAVSAVAFSADEELVMAAAGTTLHLWRPNGKQHNTITGHDAAITAVQAGDSFVLTADADGYIKAWDTDDQQQLWSIHADASVRDLVLLPQANIFLYAGSRGGESADIVAYQIRPVENRSSRPQRLGQLRFPRDRIIPPRCMAVSPDEQLLLISNSRNGELLVLPRRTDIGDAVRDRFPFVHAADLAVQSAVEWNFRPHERPVNDIAFSADGRRLATASDDRSVGVWQVGIPSASVELVARLEGHGAKVNAVGFLDSHGEAVVSAGADRYCRLWTVADYAQRQKAIEQQFQLTAIRPPATSRRALAPVFNTATGANAQRLIQVRSERLGTNRKKNVHCTARRSTAHTTYRTLNVDIPVQRGAMTSVCLSDDGTQVVTGSTDGTAVLWDTATGRPVESDSGRSRFVESPGTFSEGHDSNVARLRFLPPDGNVLLTTAFDGSLCLWDAALNEPGVGHQEVKLPGLGLVNAFAVSADGQLIVTSVASDDNQQSGSAFVWKTSELRLARSPEPIVELRDFHRAEVSAIAVSPDASQIATGARDGRIAIWRTADGTLLAGGQAHSKNSIVSHLHWLANDRLFSAGFDGRLLIFNATTSNNQSNAVANLNVESKFQHDRIPVEQTAFAADNSRFLTVSARTDEASKQTTYELELWQVDSETPIRTVLPALVRGKPGHRVSAVHWSTTGGRVAAVVDGNLQILDADTWKIVNVLEAPRSGISDAVFAPSSVRLHGGDAVDAIATFDGTTAHLWNLNDNSHLADFRPMYAVQSVAFDTAAQFPTVLTGDLSIRMFNADAESANFGDTVSKIGAPHRGIVTSLTFAPITAGDDPANRIFVSTGSDGTATAWRWNAVAEHAVVHSQLKTSGSPLSAAAWSPDAAHVLLVGRDGDVAIVAADSPEPDRQSWNVDAPDSVRLTSGAYSGDGRIVAVAGRLVDSGESRAWVYRQTDDAWRLHCTIRGHDAGGINAITFLPDSPWLVTGGADGHALIWNCQTDRQEKAAFLAYEAYEFLPSDRAVAHTAAIKAISVSKNGTVATASEDGTAVVWQKPF